MPNIRRIQIGESDLYRQVRLAALKESPEAFAATYEAGLALPREKWESMANQAATGKDRAIFLAFDNEPIGLAAVFRKDFDSNVGEIFQVWISPAYRGGSVASELMNTVFQWAASHGITELQAEVTPQNFRALRFYEKCEFVQVSSDSGNIVIKKKV